MEIRSAGRAREARLQVGLQHGAIRQGGRIGVGVTFEYAVDEDLHVVGADQFALALHLLTGCGELPHHRWNLRLRGARGRVVEASDQRGTHAERHFAVVFEPAPENELRRVHGGIENRGDALLAEDLCGLGRHGAEVCCAEESGSAQPAFCALGDSAARLAVGVHGNQFADVLELLRQRLA